MCRGSPYYNPHIGRPSRNPTRAITSNPSTRCWESTGTSARGRTAARVSGPAYRRTGYSWLQKYAINAGAHNIAAGDIRFVGVGRGALAYRICARCAEKGELDERRCCKTLTYCTT